MATNVNSETKTVLNADPTAVGPTAGAAAPTATATATATPTATATATPTPSDVDAFEGAYGRLKDELAAIAAEELQAVKLDIPSAVTTALGVLPQVRALRAQVAAELPAFDLTQFDRLEDYAFALSYAHSHYLTALQPVDDLPQLTEDGSTLRAMLTGDAQQLSARGLILGNQLTQLKGGNGYKNLATDLQVLCNVMKENWDKIQGKCATVADELGRADSLAASLMRVVGEREQGPGLVAAATDVRLRAYTAFVRAYQQTQRAVVYLRHGEGDADSLAPSLFANKSRKKSEDPAPIEPPAGPTSPVVLPPAAVVGGSAASAATSAQPTSAALAAKGPFLS